MKNAFKLGFLGLALTVAFASCNSAEKKAEGAIDSTAAALDSTAGALDSTAQAVADTAAKLVDTTATK